MRLQIVALTGSLALFACGGDSGSSDASAATDATTADTSDATVTSDATTTDASATEVRPDATSVDVPDTVGPVVCGDFAVSGTLVANDAPGTYTLGGGIDLGFGGPQPDAVVLEFYTNDTGTFDLSKNGNDNYATCDQCVRVVQDIDPADPTKTKHFFQLAGTMVIDATTPPQEGLLNVELDDLELVEVKIFADYHTEAVDNGGCFTHPGAVHLETAACVPSCGSHICGPDGCGGECGACETGRCALDGSKCEVEPTCATMTLAGGEVLDNKAAGVYRLDTTPIGLGALDERDFLQLEFYTRATGTFELGANGNEDYATCKQCVRVVLDGKREFFQSAGKLELVSGSDPIGDPAGEPPGGDVTIDLKGVHLVEVVYDDESFHATPVEGGGCIDLVLDAPLEKAP